ncbi:MAG: oligosaccharide flippase family protein [Crocinitomicaceae bacterium]|nr:oligosaccharide flippase family protein [Crocinitomicaceae bacterium]
MQKKFISNLVLLALLNLLIKPIAIFGIDATVQNRVGSEDYGLYFSLLNFTYLFNILLDFGINNYMTKNVAQYPALMQKYIGKISAVRIVLFFIYAIFTFGIAFVLQYENKVYPILLILVIQQFVIGMIAYFRSYLSGMLLFKLDALLSVLDRFMLIIICGLTLYFTTYANSFTIEHYIFIQFICYLISFFVGLLLVLKHIGTIKIKFNKPIIYLITRESYPYALLIILMALFSRVDSVMLERMLPDGARQAGVYAQGFRLLDASFMFAMLFSNLLLPIFSKMIGDKMPVKPLFQLSSKLLVWGAIALAALCYWNAENILSIIYSNDLALSTPPFQLLMLTFVAMCITLIFGTYLTALGEMKTLNIIAFVGLLINVACNIYLIPKYGAYGAAIATLFTQFAVAIAETIVVVKRLQIVYTFWTSLSFVIYTTVVFSGCWLAEKYSLNLFYQGIFLIFCLLIFKVINVQLFKTILSGRD